MSYILDALRRADAERRRGQAPVLSDVAGLPALAPHTRSGEPAPRWARWQVVAVLVAAAALVAAWLLHPADRSPSTPATTAPAVAPPSVPPTALATLPTPLPPAPVVRMPPPLPTTALPPTPPSPPTVLPPPPPAPAEPASQAAPARPLPASALPEPQRSAVSRLALGGAVASAERSQSFVLLGGQIVREGATLAPGIVLERITPRALLLRVGEQLVELPL